MNGQAGIEYALHKNMQEAEKNERLITMFEGSSCFGIANYCYAVIWPYLQTTG